MKLFRKVVSYILLIALVACGGGGGSPGAVIGNGTTSTGSTTTTASVTGDAQTTASGAISLEILNGTGAASTSISTVEIAQARATVLDAAGKPVAGAIVTFGLQGPVLLNISPAAATALTDTAGKAIVEIRAASVSSTGATSVAATVIVNSAILTVAKAISLSSAPTSAATPPQQLASALNFLNVDPANKSIVLAGSGGNGRSESATLRFRVVDVNNTPVKGVNISFSIGAAPVTLNIPTAVSDSDGVVVTTVSSGTVPTAVVITATVDTRSITSQSDQLLVTTGVATQAGFDLSATKYNLNSKITGDSTDINISIVDSNGNPVADGVPVVLTANYGAVGTSNQGGCSTLNGQCKVVYKVQDPRPADGVPAIVTASTRIGSGMVISNTIRFIMSIPDLLDVYDGTSQFSNKINLLPANGTCKKSFTVFLGTPKGFPAPAGTTIAATALTSDVTATIKSGSPVLDRAVFRNRFTVEVDLSSTSLKPACSSTGTSTKFAEISLKFTAGNTVVETDIINVSYNY